MFPCCVYMSEKPSTLARIIPLWFCSYRKEAMSVLFQSRVAYGVGRNTLRLLCSKVKPDIGELVKKSKVVVFMKGVPDEPRCGFSNAVVQVLKMHGVQYDAHNVLDSDNIRNGVKEYSNWPTIPQVFINGEFVGGCDILVQMHKSGDLIEEFKKVGIESELLKAEQKSSDK